MKLKHLLFMVLMTATMGCTTTKKEYDSFNEYPVRSGSLDEMIYSHAATTFSVWAPTADEVRLMLFNSGHEGAAYRSVVMEEGEDGTWSAKVDGDLIGKFYTFNVKIKERWKGDTPGIMAKAVGLNGKRAAVVDLKSTDPKGWDTDVRPALKSSAEAIIYEMHHRDFSVSATSGIKNKGKYLALTETGTKTMEGESTGIDHLKALGITHVHLLPSFDFASVDESRLKDKKYNWGYDPVNYNVPDGSYSTNPASPTVRIKEFKEMVQALHKANIRVVLDVVYNHTSSTDNSSFEKTVPGYFYRQKPDGSFANGSGCGNETASERPMVRKYMIESVLYWAKEYHVDGFRFDLMGNHDIETMNGIRKALDEVDPTILVYGEGWAAQAPALKNDSLAMKTNITKMLGISAFSDEMRDGLRGSWNDNSKGAFLAGVPGNEMSVKFGLVGAIKHPQVNCDSVNYSKVSWALQPTQMISYVSCHDDMCLADRLRASVYGATPQDIVSLDKLAQTAVFTSQGIPFIYAGEEIMRDKKGVHNSFESPDSINAINWGNKTLHKDVFLYYQGLIQLRKAHPAFRMGDANLVRKHMEFLPVLGSNLIAFRLKGHANGDSWEEIYVAFNSDKYPQKINVPEGKYTIICHDGMISLGGMGMIYGGEVYVPGRSALIFYK